MSNISIYASHDSSICVSTGPGEYKIYEMERLLKERYCRINNREDFKESLEMVKEIIKKDCGIDSFEKCYYGQFFAGKEVEQKGIFSNIFGVTEFEEIGHHLSHAATALYQSDFDKCLILSFDGGGHDADGVSFFNIFIADKSKNEITRLSKVKLDLGNPYSLLAEPISEVRKGNFLSYAGKVMGLTAYGKVRLELVENMKKFYRTQVFTGSRGQLLQFGKTIGLDFNQNTLSGETGYDLAATSQHVFEELALEQLLPFVEKYKLPVCVTGGCALNVLFNQRLKDELPVDVFVPPNPNDCGLSLGNMLLKEPPKGKIKITYSGFNILDIDRLPEYAIKYNAKKVKIGDLVPLLKSGKIIGVVRGGSECGPRALGNRSILCDPSYENMKDTLNKKVKFREWFRPFAPITREEDISEYFNFKGESTYMTYAPEVVEKHKNDLMSITHKDGTARVQTVTREQNSFIYDLLTEFKKEDKIGVLLNTSFNIKGRPILTTIEDAIYNLENTNMDYVLIEDFLFKKKNMKYIITAKNIREKVHITNPVLRTEICTELIMPRLKLMELLNTGKITRHDTIVTRIDRKCLYENIFDNVIDWEDYLKTKGEIDNKNIIDLASQILSLDKTLPYKPFYRRFEEDKNEILNINLSDLSNFDIENPYICLLVRKTPNHAEKNLDDNYWSNFINKFTEETKGKYNVFIFGQGVSNLSESKNVFYIDKFQDWCSIMNKENCKHLISTISGGVYPIFFTGHKDCKMTIIDNTKTVKLHSESPSFYHECINFTGIKKEILEYAPNAEELTKKITRDGNI